MKTGIEQIVKERQEQVEKHGRTVETDKIENDYLQLPSAVVNLIGKNTVFDLDDTEDYVPQGWDAAVYTKMKNKPYKERLVIAGALIAAEIDRIQ